MFRRAVAAVPAAASIAALALALAGCQERTPTCEEAVRHVQGIMKHSKNEQKRAFWTDKRTVDGQIAFCKHERLNPELLRCVGETSDEGDYEECLEKYVDR